MSFLLKKIYYRTFHFLLSGGTRLLCWRKACCITGKGCVRQIPRLLALQKTKKPMVVTGPTITKKGILKQVLNHLEKHTIPYALYNKVESNPSVDTADAIRQAYAKNNCDGFIAIGGGSPIDAAKAAAALVACPGKTIKQLGGLQKVRHKIPPFIAVPTTAGSGSETTMAALVTDTCTQHKYAIMDLHLVPHYAVLDPALTVSLPPFVTAITGMDALTHAIESYLCDTNTTTESRRLAEEAVALIFENLYTAYRDGSNIPARMALLTASYKAGAAFTRTGVGNVHAIAHTLGGLYNTPHGLANAVLLPAVLEDYGKAIYPKLACLAHCANIGSGESEKKDALLFVAAIRRLNRLMEIPPKFDFVRRADIPQMIEWALAEANPLYPVPVIYSESRCRKVIESVCVFS